jgi:formylglycine-generating enzyme
LIALDRTRGGTPNAQDPLPSSAVPGPSDEALGQPTPTSGLALSPTSIASVTIPPRVAPPRHGACPDDMILIEGTYCPFVAHKCDKARKARAPGEPEVCEKYKNLVLCEGGLETMRYCVDQFEYPNRRGVVPAVLVSFDEAERVCAVDEKRLCTFREWSFACEGEQMLPYPTGLDRSAGSCQWDAGADAHVTPSRGPTVAQSLGSQDRRVAAGGKEGCKSPFGVFDMGGNVAEWTEDPVLTKTRDPFGSVIAGGDWGRGPNICRARDDAHPPPHRSAMLGFRCCSEPAEAGETSTPAKKPRRRTKGGFQPLLTGTSTGLPRGLP